jgi:hypothetical protein
MPLRAGNVFYFLFNAESQKLIDATTLTAPDVAYEAAPAPGQPYPQSLRLQFKLTNPGKKPQVRPLGPGQLEWLPDPGGTLPEPAQAIPANIATWPINGTLKLTIKDSEVARRMAELSGLPVVPNVLWYSKVRLTNDFLFTSLAALPKTPAPLGRKGSVPTDRSDWINHAVASFLRGRYKPELVADADPAKDSLATVAMPDVVAEAGAAELVITAALDANAFDGVDANFENPADIKRSDPAHPRNGAIPARVVYRALRAPAAGVMADAAVGLAIPDRTLEWDPQLGPRYFPVRFTRVWQAIPDCSVHFPSQVVQAEWRPLGIVKRQRLAAHGWLWISLPQAQVGAGTEFRLTVSNPSARPEREMLWLKGETKDAWMKAAENVPVDYDLAAGIPHIILRRRMGQEVVYDRRQRPTADGAACTYFSLRRFVRALVNNRIAGGRLNFESFWPGRLPKVKERRNTAETRRLVEAALGKQAANRVLDGRPDPWGDIGDSALSLIPVLEQFFPGIVPAQTIDGSTFRSPGNKYSLGLAAYFVWQSVRKILLGTDTSWAPTRSGTSPKTGWVEEPRGRWWRPDWPRTTPSSRRRSRAMSGTRSERRLSRTRWLTAWSRLC